MTTRPAGPSLPRRHVRSISVAVCLALVGLALAGCSPSNSSGPSIFDPNGTANSGQSNPTNPFEGGSGGTVPPAGNTGNNQAVVGEWIGQGEGSGGSCGYISSLYTISADGQYSLSILDDDCPDADIDLSGQWSTRGDILVLDAEQSDCSECSQLLGDTYQGFQVSSGTLTLCGVTTQGQVTSECTTYDAETGN